MHFKFLADHTKAIPLIAEWYFTEWGHKAEEDSAGEFSLRLKKYLNRDKFPLIILEMDGENVIGTAQLKYK